MPQMHRNVYNSTRSQPVGLSSTLFMQHLDLKTLGYLLCTTIHDLRD